MANWLYTFICYRHGIKYRTRRFIGKELILVIGNFSENLPILNLPIINNYGHALKAMMKLEKKDKVARITNIKSANCFLQQIRQILLLPINRLVRYISYNYFISIKYYVC